MSVSLAAERVERLSQEPLREMSPKRGFFSGIAYSWSQVWHRRELLTRLVQREIKARYKDSVLGLVWTLIRPIMQLLVYWLVMGKFLQASKNITDFPIFVFTGLTCWGLFSEIVTNGTGSILSNAGLIKKIQLPRDVFPLSAAGVALFNFSIQLVLLIVVSAATKSMHFDIAFGYMLAGIFVMLVWGLAFAYVLSAANVYLRDVQYLVDVVMMLGFWASPIVYSWTMVSAQFGAGLQNLYLANPMTSAIMGMQKFFWKGGDIGYFPEYLGVRLLVFAALGVVVLFVCQRLFDRMQRNFAQEI